MCVCLCWHIHSTAHMKKSEDSHQCWSVSIFHLMWCRMSCYSHLPPAPHTPMPGQLAWKLLGFSYLHFPCTSNMWRLQWNVDTFYFMWVLIFAQQMFHLLRQLHNPLRLVLSLKKISLLPMKDYEYHRSKIFWRNRGPRKEKDVAQNTFVHYVKRVTISLPNRYVWGFVLGRKDTVEKIQPICTIK